MRKIIILWGIILVGCSSVEERQQNLIQKGYMSMDEGQLKRAIKYFDDAIELNKDNASAWNAKGVALYKDDAPYEAVHAFDQAVLLKPDYTRAYYNRSNAFYRVGEYYRALDDLTPALTAYKDSAFVYLAKGLVEVGLENYQEAKNSFRAALEIDSLNAETITNLASVYYFQDSVVKAEKWVRDALIVDPNEANAWNLLSLIQTDLEQYEEALLSIEKATSLKKFQPYFLNNRGYIHIMLGNYDSAYADLRQSISIDEQNAYVYRNFGVLAFKKADYKEAKRQLKLGLNKQEMLPLAHFYMGEVFREQDSLKEACSYYKVGMEAGEAEAKNAYSEFCL